MPNTTFNGHPLAHVVGPGGEHITPNSLRAQLATQAQRNADRVIDQHFNREHTNRTATTVQARISAETTKKLAELKQRLNADE